MNQVNFSSNKKRIKRLTVKFIHDRTSSKNNKSWCPKYNGIFFLCFFWEPAFNLRRPSLCLDRGGALPHINEEVSKNSPISLRPVGLCSLRRRVTRGQGVEPGGKPCVSTHGTSRLSSSRVTLVRYFQFTWRGFQALSRAVVEVPRVEPDQIQYSKNKGGLFKDFSTKTQNNNKQRNVWWNVVRKDIRYLLWFCRWLTNKQRMFRYRSTIRQ